MPHSAAATTASYYRDSDPLETALPFLVEPHNQTLHVYDDLIAIVGTGGQTDFAVQNPSQAHKLSLLKRLSSHRGPSPSPPYLPSSASRSTMARLPTTSQPSGQRAYPPPPSYSEAVVADSRPSTSVPCGTQDAQSLGIDQTYRTATALSSSSVAHDNDTAYGFLADYDIVFLGDDSGSMKTNMSLNLVVGGTLWDEFLMVIQAILAICLYWDKDGIDIYFFNTIHEGADGQPVAGIPEQGKAAGGHLNIKSEEEVRRLFKNVKPEGATPTGTRVKDVIVPYVDRYEVRKRETGDPNCMKPLNVIVITDGEPTSTKQDPMPVIQEVARRLDLMGAPLNQLGIQFCQVGVDEKATKALKKLDNLKKDEKGNRIRDIVDTVTFDNIKPSKAAGGARVLTDALILKTVGGAVERRLDKMKVGGEESSWKKPLKSLFGR